MGVSTDALLVYGYVWEDEEDILNPQGDEEGDEERGEREWPEIIAEKRGIADPWKSYPAEIERLPYEEKRAKGREWTDAHRAELDAWSGAKKAITAEYGVEIEHHGSGEWSCPIVCAAKRRAARGDAHALPADALGVDPEWDGKLARFVADLGIDTSDAQGPGWFLVSYWG